MKLTKYILVATAALAVASCSKWTEPERKSFAGQGDIERIIPEPPAKPLIEIKTEAELNNTQREYYKKIREYRQTPHVLGFGWFGNWTGQGTDPMRHLKTLPDSVDFVSLWGTRTPLTESQKADLKFFQDVKGGKALLCWIVQDLGGPLTPPEYKGREQDYWTQKGNGSHKGAAIAYANALCDTIEKYNLDGFDIDYEPNYGHTGNLANSAMIDKNTGNTAMYAFIETMYNRFKGTGRMIVFDGQPEKLSTEASKMIDFYIYQAYWEQSANDARYKAMHSNLDRYTEKTILTAEYEQTWREGNGRGYRASDAGVQALLGGRQIADYAVIDFADGNRIAGIGTYHMEYDKSDEIPYRWLRQALEYGNKTKPGKFTGKLPAPVKP